MAALPTLADCIKVYQAAKDPRQKEAAVQKCTSGLVASLDAGQPWALASLTDFDLYNRLQAALFQRGAGTPVATPAPARAPVPTAKPSQPKRQAELSAYVEASTSKPVPKPKTERAAKPKPAPAPKMIATSFSPSSPTDCNQAFAVAKTDAARQAVAAECSKLFLRAINPKVADVEVFKFNAFDKGLRDIITELRAARAAAAGHKAAVTRHKHRVASEEAAIARAWQGAPGSKPVEPAVRSVDWSRLEELALQGDKDAVEQARLLSSGQFSEHVRDRAKALLGRYARSPVAEKRSVPKPAPKVVVAPKPEPVADPIKPTPKTVGSCDAMRSAMLKVVSEEIQAFRASRDEYLGAVETGVAKPATKKSVELVSIRIGALVRLQQKLDTLRC